MEKPIFVDFGADFWLLLQALTWLEKLAMSPQISNELQYHVFILL